MNPAGAEKPELGRRRRRLDFPEDWELVDSRGVGPFDDSAEVFRLSDGSRYIWESRRHRKGRGPRDATGAAYASATMDFRPESRSESPWLEFYAPRRLSWWIAVVFIAGSAMFTLGASASLFGRLFASYGSFVSEVSYFAGAIFFTIGIYLQLLEGLNANDAIGSRRPKTARKFVWFAWLPRRLEFTAPFILLIGSLLFNAETSMALFGGFPVWVGVLSLFGSALFVVSTYLSFVEVCNRYISFRPREISWWVAVFNLVGSVGFVVGSAFGFQIPGLSSPQESLVTSASFLFGSALFLIGSYLLLPEMFSE